MVSNKGVIDKVEEASHADRRHSATAQHGDRALALIGDERVSLTEEDVCLWDCGNMKACADI
jgi:hypothetical protein